MRLDPVHVGGKVDVGVRSTVVPGHTVPANSHVFAKSSSHDVAVGQMPEQYMHHLLQGPSWFLTLLVAVPLIILEELIAFIPYVTYLYWLFSNDFGVTAYPHEALWHHIVNRLTTWQRVRMYAVVPFFILARQLIRYIYTVIVKSLVLGNLEPGCEVTDWDAMRSWMMPRMLRADLGHYGVVKQVVEVLGTHFEMVSWVYRLLGAKAGERIYWPGHGIYCNEWELVEVGDDVIFGSRTMIFCQGSKGARKVKIESGSMVADRCVLLPGCNIGSGALIGSGSVGPADTRLESGSVVVGHKQGKPVITESLKKEQSDGKFTRPFGKAYYARQANYFVVPSVVHSAHALFCYWCDYVLGMFPFFASLYLTMFCENRCYFHMFAFATDHDLLLYRSLAIAPFLLFWLISFGMVSALEAYIVLEINVFLKNVVIGQRIPGSYSWDESSYCQRWLFERRHRSCVQWLFALTRGTPFISWYFNKCGADIGEGVCLYATGADPYMMEPDLIKIGKFSCIDKAVLIGHTNPYGKLNLDKLEVGERSAMLSDAKLSLGCVLGSDSVLLENSLALPGDVIPDHEVWQGWPANQYVTEHKQR